MRLTCVMQHVDACDIRLSVDTKSCDILVIRLCCYSESHDMWLLSHPRHRINYSCRQSSCLTCTIVVRDGCDVHFTHLFYRIWTTSISITTWTWSLSRLSQQKSEKGHNLETHFTCAAKSCVLPSLLSMPSPISSWKRWCIPTCWCIAVYLCSYRCFDWYVQVQVQGWFITLMTVFSAHTTCSWWDEFAWRRI